MGGSVPRGCLAKSGSFLVVITVSGEGLYWHPVSGSQDTAKGCAVPRVAPQTETDPAPV